MDRSNKLSLDKIEDELKKIVRRQEVMQKSLDTLYEDRGILEDLQGQMRNLQEQFQLNRQNSERRNQDVKYEIQNVQDKVQDSMAEMGDKVEQNIGTLVKEIKTKDVVVVKESFLQRIKHLLKK